MKRIEVFYLSRMNQQKTFWFFKQIYNQMEKIEDKRFQPLLHSFVSAFSLFDRSLKPNEGALLEKIETENSNCDKEWKNLKELTRQTISENLSEGKNLAKVIQKVIDNNEDPTTFTGSKKIDLFNKIFSELENKVSLKDNSTDLCDTLSSLNRAAWAYEQYLEAHNNEMAGKFISRRSLEARKKTEQAYYSAVEFLNAMFIYIGTEGYEKIIDEINRIIEMGKATPIIDIHSDVESNSYQKEAEYSKTEAAFSA